MQLSVWRFAEGVYVPLQYDDVVSEMHGCEVSLMLPEESMVREAVVVNVGLLDLETENLHLTVPSELYFSDPWRFLPVVTTLLGLAAGSECEIREMLRDRRTLACLSRLQWAEAPAPSDRWARLHHRQIRVPPGVAYQTRNISYVQIPIDAVCAFYVCKGMGGFMTVHRGNISQVHHIESPQNADNAERLFPSSVEPIGLASVAAQPPTPFVLSASPATRFMTVFVQCGFINAWLMPMFLERIMNRDGQLQDAASGALHAVLDTRALPTCVALRAEMCVTNEIPARFAASAGARSAGYVICRNDARQQHYAFNPFIVATWRGPLLQV